MSSPEVQTLVVARETMIATWALVVAGVGSLIVALGQLNRFVAAQILSNTLAYIDKFTSVLHEVRDDYSISIHTAMSTVGAYFNAPASILAYKRIAEAYRLGVTGSTMSLTKEQIQLHLEVTNSLIISLTYFRQAATLIGRHALDFDLIWAQYEGMFRRLIDLSTALRDTERFAMRAAEDKRFMTLPAGAKSRKANLLRRTAHWVADRLSNV